MKKNIYTITFHKANNFGALLQAFALQTFLINNGYDSKILDYDNFYVSNSSRFIPKNVNLIKGIRHVLIRIINIFSELKRQKNYNTYRKKLILTDKIETVNLLKEDFIDKDHENILITGSDQVWNPKITMNYDEIYFLKNFSRSFKKISYAASCGSLSKVDDKDKFIEYIKKIDYVSVRENELSEFLSRNNINSTVVVDPTLLLLSNEWVKSISTERIIKNKYIFTYSAGNANDMYYEIINELSKQLGLEVVFFDRICKKIKSRKNNCFYAGPNEFLNLLINSEMVITSSFHGFALSSILNKSMICVLNNYPERLITLAKKIGLDNRIVDNVNDAKLLCKNEINWNSVNNKIEKERAESIKWLLSAIEGSKDE